MLLCPSSRPKYNYSTCIFTLQYKIKLYNNVEVHSIISFDIYYFLLFAIYTSSYLLRLIFSHIVGMCIGISFHVFIFTRYCYDELLCLKASYYLYYSFLIHFPKRAFTDVYTRIMLTSVIGCCTTNVTWRESI